MSKWHEVKVTTVTVYAVEVEDNETAEDAEQAVLDDIFDWDEVTVSEEIMTPEEIDRIKRHADEVLSLKG